MAERCSDWVPEAGTCFQRAHSLTPDPCLVALALAVQYLRIAILLAPTPRPRQDQPSASFTQQG